MFHILKIYTTTVVWYGISVQPPYGTTVVGGAPVLQPLYHTTAVNSTPARGTVAPATVVLSGSRGSIRFKKS
jgi:D-hexose-6-phosphate mutarotase